MSTDLRNRVESSSDVDENMLCVLVKKKVNRYLNTTGYAWYIVSMLCLNYNIDYKVSPKV